MIDANAFWTMMLCILGSILLVVLIILGVKLIATVNKIDNLVDDLTVKVGKFDNIFGKVDVFSDSIALLSDKTVNILTNLIKKIFTKKEKREEDDIYEEE